MRRRFQRFLISLAKRFNPGPDIAVQNRDLKAENRILADLVETQLHDQKRAETMDRVSELIEARQMAGAGPWKVDDGVLAETDHLIGVACERLGIPTPAGVSLRETAPVIAAGATGDIELALQNVEWRREINLSWLEFSRWGIQQIILVSRLYWLKNPIIRRLIDVASCYVFARGVEVTTDDDTANDVLAEFFERNKAVLGQIALVDLEKRKYYDGNLFFAFFADTQDTGLVNVRTIDATEIQDIITNPDDVDEPWFYRRKWSQRNYDNMSGVTNRTSMEAWYPAIGDHPERGTAEKIDGQPVLWKSPVLHRKCGSVSKWLFGCPLIYPALDWAKASRRYLEACATVKQSLATIAMTLTTKGGQQALEGAKQSLSTTVGPTSNLWDANPPPVNASIFASGPGTTLAAFNTKGGGGDPEEVRQYKLMCAMVVGVPETFLSDVSTGNLATATTLDRPTELVFLEKQEAWREDLATIAKFVLSVSGGASSGKLREAHPMPLKIVECARVRKPGGALAYEAAKNTPGTVKVKVLFPSIREGDMAVNVKAIVEAMTLDNKGGQVVGIDEKTGVLLLMEELGVENPEEILDEMYPAEYDPDRTVEPLPAPIGRAEPDPGGEPQLPGGSDPAPATKKVAAAERFIEALQRLKTKRTYVVPMAHDTGGRRQHNINMTEYSDDQPREPNGQFAGSGASAPSRVVLTKVASNGQKIEITHNMSTTDNNFSKGYTVTIDGKQHGDGSVATLSPARTLSNGTVVTHTISNNVGLTADEFKRLSTETGKHASEYYHATRSPEQKASDDKLDRIASRPSPEHEGNINRLLAKHGQ